MCCDLYGFLEIVEPSLNVVNPLPTFQTLMNNMCPVQSMPSSRRSNTKGVDLYQIFASVSDNITATILLLVAVVRKHPIIMLDVKKHSYMETVMLKYT